MSTQHPDNARAPYWKKSGDGFISTNEEMSECIDSFRNLNVEELMWDWEGKFTDEAVIDRMFRSYFDYFKKQPLGYKKRLTFRIPNIWQEKGYSLIRALVVILTSEDFARDLHFHSPPIFEIILPMTENAEQLIFIQKSFRELARLKSKMFSGFVKNTEYICIIPLFESIETQLNAKVILVKYLKLHKSTFGFNPSYMRVFIARSDPAMTSGLVSAVLANKIALSDLRELEEQSGIPIFPILGAGSLPFRGALNPLKMKEFVSEYPGVSTVTIQSGFKYDYPVSRVKQAIKYFNNRSTAESERVSKEDRSKLVFLVGLFERQYRFTLNKVIKDMQFVFRSFPRRRERHLYIGLLSYSRKINKMILPRAITFTGSFYSLGIPPEFLDMTALDNLSHDDITLICKYYKNYSNHLIEAGKFLNLQNVRKLLKKNIFWKNIEESVNKAEKTLNIKFIKKEKVMSSYQKLTTSLLKVKSNTKKVEKIIVQTGFLRRSLG